MKQTTLFCKAWGYQEDVLKLPVESIDTAAEWYGRVFGMREVSRHSDSVPSVVLERDGVKIGFAQTGACAKSDGAAIRVSDIQQTRQEMRAHGASMQGLHIQRRGEEQFLVFSLVAPDGLRFHFHQKLESSE